MKKNSLVIASFLIAAACSSAHAAVFDLSFNPARIKRMRDAHALAQKGDVEGALAGYRELLAGDPDSAVLSYNVGVLLYEKASYH